MHWTSDTMQLNMMQWYKQHEQQVNFFGSYAIIVATPQTITVNCEVFCDRIGETMEIHTNPSAVTSLL